MALSCEMEKSRSVNYRYRVQQLFARVHSADTIFSIKLVFIT